MIINNFEVYNKIREQLKNQQIEFNESILNKIVCFDFETEYHFRFKNNELYKLTEDEIKNLYNEDKGIYYVYINDPNDKPMNKRDYKVLLDKLDSIDKQLLNISILLNTENMLTNQVNNEMKVFKDFQTYINENIPHLNSIFSGKKMKDILIILNDITDSVFTEKDNINNSLLVIKEKLDLMLQQDLLLNKLKNLNLI